MSNELAASPKPKAVGLNSLQTWALALVPSEDNYTLIMIDPNVSLGRAYLWLAVSALVGGVISTLVSIGIDLVLGPSTNPLLASLGQGTVTLQGTINSLLFGVPIQVVFILIGLTIGLGASQLLAKALGGRGTFTQLFYAFAASFAPLMFFNSLISSLPLVGLLVLFIGLYGLVLNVIATKTVHDFGWGRAVMASVIVPLALLVLLVVVVLLALALLGPAIGNVFSTIVNNI